MVLGTVVGLERLDVVGVHSAGNLVGLPLLEREAGSGVGVVLAVRLVLVVLDPGGVRVGGSRIEGEGDDGVDGRGLDVPGEGPGLCATGKSSERRGAKDGRTCAFLNWMRSGSFVTTW